MLRAGDGPTHAILGPNDAGLIPQQAAQVRDGSDVALTGCIEIPASTWTVTPKSDR